MHDTEQLLHSFSQEMDKIALAPGALKALWQRTGGGAGIGLGFGGAAGGAGGALYGGVQGYQQAKEQGAGTRAAIFSGLGGAVEKGLAGATGGMAAGAALGGAAGAARVLTPEHAAKLVGREGALGSIARFGQRQVHGVTGWKPEAAQGGMESLRFGSHGTKKTLDSLEGSIAKGEYKPGRLARAEAAIRSALPGKVVTPQELALGRAQKAHATTREAEDMGLTSIPGYLKSLKTHGVGRTIKGGLAQQWHSGGHPGKAMMVGLPAGSIASAAMNKDPEGPGLGERLGGSLGSLAYSMAPLPLGAATLLGSVLEGGGRRAGALADRGVPDPTEGYDIHRGMLSKAPEGKTLHTQVANAGKGLAGEVGL